MGLQVRVVPWDLMYFALLQPGRYALQDTRMQMCAEVRVR
jgi:hypothetical protein